MSPDPIDFAAELARRQHAADAVAEFNRRHGDPYDLIRQMVASYPEAVEACVRTCTVRLESGAKPVVRIPIRGSASPAAAMVLCQDDERGAS